MKSEYAADGAFELLFPAEDFPGLTVGASEARDVEVKAEVDDFATEDFDSTVSARAASGFDECLALDFDACEPSAFDRELLWWLWPGEAESADFGELEYASIASI